jgi:hypothetical protein
MKILIDSSACQVADDKGDEIVRNLITTWAYFFHSLIKLRLHFDILVFSLKLKLCFGGVIIGRLRSFWLIFSKIMKPPWWRLKKKMFHCLFAQVLAIGRCWGTIRSATRDVVWIDIGRRLKNCLSVGQRFCNFLDQDVVWITDVSKSIDVLDHVQHMY